MRILVTGAGGFVGGHLLPNLIEAGHEVVAASHRPLDAPGALAAEVFDIREADAVGDVVDKYEPDAVIHLAAQASVPHSWTDPSQTYETNVIGASNLLESLKERTATRVLLVGSAQVYGSAEGSRPLNETDPLAPVSPYAVSKVAQEFIGLAYHRQFGIPVIVARSFNHTGPGQSSEYAIGSFCSKIAEIERGGRPHKMEVGRLETRRDFLDVREVVEAYRLLTEAAPGGEIYNVASGQAVRTGDLLEMLLKLSGLAGKVEVVENETPRPGDPEVLVGDVSKLISAVEWKPKIPLEKSLVDTLDWYRKQLA